jgi:hypothetical protein
VYLIDYTLTWLLAGLVIAKSVKPHTAAAPGGSL